MRNIIDAICELIKNTRLELSHYSDSHNSATSMGMSLEEYIKDLFAGSVNDSSNRNKLIQEHFAYSGNKNNPPDAMLKGGDAIEVKKVESVDNSIALNSSYPKAKLYANSSMISKACRECESWDIRDMIYAVGVVRDNNLSALSFVYGSEYCADKDTYKRIKNTIKAGVESIANVEFSDTKELGRINMVDPLGITYLRVRGMWGIQNPFKVFSYVYDFDKSKKFNFMALINQEKFNSFSNKESLYDLAKEINKLLISQVEVKDPNNPAKLIPSILISYSI